MNALELGRNGPETSALGLGCTAMTSLYAKPDPNEDIVTIRAAVDAEVTMTAASRAPATPPAR